MIFWMSTQPIVFSGGDQRASERLMCEVEFWEVFFSECARVFSVVPQGATCCLPNS